MCVMITYIYECGCTLVSGIEQCSGAKYAGTTCVSIGDDTEYVYADCSSCG